MNTHDDEHDPTGMRELLRGLPDPGPMPSDLVDRIHASLAALPTFDADGPVGESGDLTDFGTGPSEGQSVHGVRAVGSSPTDVRSVHDVSRGTVTPIRPSFWARHGSKAAVAAVVLVGGGALASGPLGLWGSGASSSSDSAAVAGAGSDSGTDGGQAAGDGDMSTDSGAAPEEARGSAVKGPVIVRHSGRDYASASLASDLTAATTGPTTRPLTAESPGIGPIGTEIGVRSCLEALGLPPESGADVDLASLDGTPAAMVIVALDGGRTAYAVGRDCTTGNPHVLAGPITVP